MSYRVDNLMSVKRSNRSAALWILHEQGNLSRKRLAENMHLTPAAITKIVGEMIGEGRLCRHPGRESSAGHIRPKTEYKRTGVPFGGLRFSS